MPHINKNPIGLSNNEILAVIAFLQQMSGEPIGVSLSEITQPTGTTAPPAAAAVESNKLTMLTHRKPKN
jgi:hypothetical protein